MKINCRVILFMVPLFVLISCNTGQKNKDISNELFYPDSKPLTRWWWFASEIQKRDVAYQLNWLNENHFGGVEIAFIYPVDGDTAAPRYPFLGKKSADVVDYTKSYADSLGLHCDFTFGTLWPFGGIFVHNRDAT